LGRKLGDRERVLAVLMNMGYAGAVRGDFERAEALLEENLAMARELKHPHFTAMSLLGLGIVATRRGDHGQAKTLLEEGLVLSRKLGYIVSVAECLETLAGLAGALGDFPRAARLWGAADALREVTGCPWSRKERRLHEPYLAAARSRTDQATWEAAFTEGRSMTIEEAISYALEESTKRRA
jgi:tetratricopeptide (TPR) repeat protein